MTYSEGELTERIADHFEKEVRHAFTGQQVKSKSKLFQILTDYDNDDKRDQNRKTDYDQNKSGIKSDERSEKYSQNKNQNENKDQQRKSWQTRDINAIQIQNKNKSSTQMSHDNLDIFGIGVESTTSTSKSEN